MTKKQKLTEEIIKYNLINSLLAGSLILIGAFSSGSITLESFIMALSASVVVAITRFKEFWEKGTPTKINKKGGLFSFF